MNELSTLHLQELRERLEAIVEIALEILDELDGDPDREEDSDLEPSLGWPEDGLARIAKNVPHDDRELAVDDGLEDDRAALHDVPGHIPGGQGL